MKDGPPAHANRGVARQGTSRFPGADGTGAVVLPSSTPRKGGHVRTDKEVIRP
jgi:hypothetical protein